jgi:hypothetical protein
MKKFLLIPFNQKKKKKYIPIIINLINNYLIFLFEKKNVKKYRLLFI